MHACMHTCIHTYMRVYIYVYMHMYIDIHIYIYMYIHRYKVGIQHEVDKLKIYLLATRWLASKTYVETNCLQCQELLCCS